MTDIDPVLAERVQTGIGVLDEHRPGWLETIDLEHLDLSLSCQCVLGQLWGNFDNGILVLEADHDVPYMAWEMGFEIHSAEIFTLAREEGDLTTYEKSNIIARGYDALDRAWKTAILERRLGGKR